MTHATLPVFTLCDAASVREGLLHILGAGINSIHREGEYPAEIGATIAAVVAFKGEKPRPPRLTLRISTSEGEPIGIEDLVLGPTEEEEFELDSGPIYTIPIVVNISEMNLPSPGRYRISCLSEMGTTYSEIEFDAD